MASKKTFVDLNDLRSEYESTYLSYWNKENPLLSFEKWLKKEKGIVLIKKVKK